MFGGVTERQENKARVREGIAQPLSGLKIIELEIMKGKKLFLNQVSFRDTFPITMTLITLNGLYETSAVIWRHRLFIKVLIHFSVATI